MQAWATWLRPTAGKLRVDCLAKRVCNAPDEHAMLQGVNEACAPRNDTLSHLFSIYIHPSPAFKGYPKGSIFRGREISPRIKVEWGSWSIVEVSCLLGRLLHTPSAEITLSSMVSKVQHGACLACPLQLHWLHGHGAKFAWKESYS